MSEIDREIVEAIEPREASKPQHMPTRRGRNRSSGSAKVTVEDGGKKAQNSRAKRPAAKATAKGIKEGTVTSLQVMGWVMPPREIWPIDESDRDEVEALEQFCESAASVINRLPESVRAVILRAAAGGGWATDLIGLGKSLQRLVLPRLMLLKMYQASPADWQPMNGQAAPATAEAAPAWINQQAA